MRVVGVVLVLGVVMWGISSGPVAAQTPQFQHLQGGHIEDVFFLDANRGWTAEEGSRIRFTTDGGQTWHFANTDAVDDPSGWVQLKGVFALDLGLEGIKVWAVGEGGVVLVSTDAAGQFFVDANQNARVTNDVGEGDPCQAVGQLADLEDIFMLSVDAGWVVGVDGVLKYTADGGTTWWGGAEVNTPFQFETPFGCADDPYDGYRIHFFADSGFSKGIIASEFTHIFLTDDGGATWHLQSPVGMAPSVCPEIVQNLEFWGMGFDDPDDPDSTMWLSGGIGPSQGYVFERTGGWSNPSWVQKRCYHFNNVQSIENAGQCSLSTMYSLAMLGSSQRHPVIAGYAGQLFSWETGTANFDACACDDLGTDSCGTNVDTWVQQATGLADPDPCVPAGAFFGSARIDADSSVSVGDFGRMTRFDDGAQNEIVELGTKHFTRLFDGKFLSSSTGFVVGQRNTIFGTTDGGQSWLLKGDFSTCGASDNFNAIDFSDDGQYGVVVGNDGYVAYSSDGGDTWSRYVWPVPPGQPTNDFTAVDFAPDSERVFIVGTGGVVKWSDNGGAGWRNAASPGSHDLYGVSFASDDVGYVCGADLRVYRTVNGGGSWSRVTVNGGSSETLRDIEQWDSGTKAMAVGDNGRVFQKTSSTFEQIDDDAGFPADVTGALFDVEVLNDGANIRIGGDNGVVLFRDGTTWTRVRSLTNSPIYKLSFQDVDEGFAVGQSFFVGRYE